MSAKEIKNGFNCFHALVNKLLGDDKLSFQCTLTLGKAIRFTDAKGKSRLGKVISHCNGKHFHPTVRGKAVRVKTSFGQIVTVKHDKISTPYLTFANK